MGVIDFKTAGEKYYKPDPEVIKVAESILDKAKSGEIQTLDVVCGNTKEVWYESVSSNKGGSIFGMIGAHHCMMMDMRDRLEGIQ